MKGNRDHPARCANASPLRGLIGIFRILQPIGGVVEDVLPDGVQFFIVADDALVIIPLPHWRAGGLSHLVDAPGRDRFEIPDDCAE